MTRSVSRWFARLLVPALFGLGGLAVASDLSGLATPLSTPRPEYQGPGTLAVSPDGRTLYVANEDSREVLWVELDGGRVVGRADTPGSPTGLVPTPDGRRLIVTCEATPASDEGQRPAMAPETVDSTTARGADSRGTIAVLDVASGKQITVLEAGHWPMSPVLSPDGRRLYVCNRFDNDVAVIDLACGRQLSRVPTGREPIAAAIAPDGRTLVVANHLPNMRTDRDFRGDVAPVVTVVDTRTLECSSITLLHGSNGVRGMCISPDGNWAFVTHLLSNFEELPFRVDMGWIDVNVVSIIDVRARKLVRTLGLDEPDQGAANPWGIVCTSNAVCVSLAGTHEMCVIDRERLLSDAARTMAPMMGVWPIYPSLGGSLWRRVKVPGEGPRGLAAVGSTVYGALYFSDRVAVVDTADAEHPRLSAIALGPPPQVSAERRGQMLFNDATLCYQQWLSCASCHPDGRADGLNWDLMNDGVGNSKNTKSMLWAHRTPPAMAEGVRMSAEEAVRSGLKNILFEEQPEETSQAIVAYLKSLRPVPSPRLVHGRLSPAARRGEKLFHDQRLHCDRCHPAPYYTDMQRHNVDSRSRGEHREFFDTPTLVEVWRTAPYLHDGRWSTLESLFRDGRHGMPRHGRTLTDRELNDLVEFVQSL